MEYAVVGLILICVGGIFIIFVGIISAQIHDLEKQCNTLYNEVELVYKFVQASENNNIEDYNDLVNRVNGIAFDTSCATSGTRDELNKLTLLVNDIKCIKTVSNGLNKLYEERAKNNEGKGLFLSEVDKDEEIPEFFIKRDGKMEDKADEKV